jgi:hypothetical protein
MIFRLPCTHQGAESRKEKATRPQFIGLVLGIVAAALLSLE